MTEAREKITVQYHPEHYIERGTRYASIPGWTDSKQARIVYEVTTDDQPTKDSAWTRVEQVTADQRIAMNMVGDTEFCTNLRPVSAELRAIGYPARQCPPGVEGSRARDRPGWSRPPAAAA